MGEDHLQRFAQTVVELQERKAARIDEETVNRVARDLGMSDEDIAKAREESRMRKARAQALRSSGNLDDAIHELELGFGFNPLDLEIMYMLADGLYTRSQKTNDQGEWERAKDLCLRLVEIAPAHKEAASLLNAINNNAPDKKPDFTNQKAILVGVAVFGAIVVGLVLHFLVGLF